MLHILSTLPSLVLTVVEEVGGFPVAVLLSTLPSLVLT